MKTETGSFYGSLTSGELIIIPTNQRLYCWSKEAVADFFRHIRDVGIAECEGRLSHRHYGYVCFESEIVAGKMALYVLDGQQRLITSVIMIAAVLHVVSECPSSEFSKKSVVQLKNILLNNGSPLIEFAPIRPADNLSVSMIVAGKGMSAVGTFGTNFNYMVSLVKEEASKGVDVAEIFLEGLKKTQISCSIFSRALGDDPARVFLDTNTKGVLLTAADIIIGETYSLLERNSENPLEMRKQIAEMFHRPLLSICEDASRMGSKQEPPAEKVVDAMKSFFEIFLKSLGLPTGKKMVPSFLSLFEGKISDNERFEVLDFVLESANFWKESQYAIVRNKQSVCLDFLEVVGLIDSIKFQKSAMPFIVASLRRMKNNAEGAPWKMLLSLLARRAVAGGQTKDLGDALDLATKKMLNDDNMTPADAMELFVLSNPNAAISDDMLYANFSVHAPQPSVKVALCIERRHNSGTGMDVPAKVKAFGKKQKQTPAHFVLVPDRAVKKGVVKEPDCTSPEKISLRVQELVGVVIKEFPCLYVNAEDLPERKCAVVISAAERELRIQGEEQRDAVGKLFDILSANAAEDIHERLAASDSENFRKGKSRIAGFFRAGTSDIQIRASLGMGELMKKLSGLVDEIRISESVRLVSPQFRFVEA